MSAYLIREDIADYFGEVAAFDAGLGVLLDELKRVGELDNTMIVVSGDHGPPGFPHGKCNLYDFGTRVSLAIAGPHVIGGRVVDDLTFLPDLAPTPLGVYVDGGYTYVPLRDESGTVVGHYFFVYGGDENAGRDVFTPDNLAEPEDFRVAKDGENDGVVGFSFDGVALEHVEDWSGDGDDSRFGVRGTIT